MVIFFFFTCKYPVSTDLDTNIAMKNTPLCQNGLYLKYTFTISFKALLI